MQESQVSDQDMEERLKVIVKKEMKKKKNGGQRVILRK